MERQLLASPSYPRATLIPSGVYATDVRKLLITTRDFFAGLESDPDAASLENRLHEIATTEQVAPTDLFKILRVALAWPLASPSLYETIAGLGRAEVARRLDVAVVYLSDVAN